ncbi:TPA: efflux RND transporter periplasmic adaptor subunit [Campylobacter lari]|uniref:Macrolide-specific efflux protein, membrane fusion protein MacA n=1 Tax=Campylobacter lari (strain RM2100 / D67 / ATCC BAA-1060) TaxID=306263 RepID=B9KCF4_CAMLR|nr:efflux RND transporter periplasmic adaptor subunit [Campylobacter lari]ACM64243.1 macrolide-specific efflux protein, membrane fusion protein MacA [Campylobacter lari RM2100]EAH5176646.1 efflux RND transporter periplasmic adaptor subunit [Campylobacter lari]EAH8152253.1 efflux RND transporter periplasmic adaptor subunit [Campylobacter lari]EAI4303265.1 efflux RND transporter periplasmic adaptor subunit [Campylobacter lari]EAI4483134.1 efflux RND transporter periplasmic adaptor subunit [Campy
MKKIIYLSMFLIILIIGVYFFFFANKEEYNYLTYEAKKQDITQSIEAIGEVYAKTQVDVGAQVSGQITKLHVKLGDHVDEGDLIAQIDKDKQQNDLDITKAQLESAKANLESKKIALDIATKQYQREQKLYAKKATSLENLENLKNTFYALRANVADLKAQTTQLEISLKNAQKDLAFTTITAPSKGEIINVAVEEGQTVNANQNTPSIVRLADLSEMEIRMQIAEADINKISVGKKVKFSILNEPDKKYEAVISSIDPANTTISDATSNTNLNSSSSASTNAVYYYARVFVKNDNNFLRIGMSTENEIAIKTENNTLVIPTLAIKSDTKGYYVEILKANNISVKTPVKLGIKDSLNTQILDGINEGDLVIIGKNKK